MSSHALNESELAHLERLLGFRVDDYPDLFDFGTPVAVKRRQTASLALVTQYRGTTACMIAYPGTWTNSREVVRSCSGQAEVVDHLVPLSTNRIQKLLGVRPVPGRKVQTQSIGSAHISNLIGACKACNGRKLQKLDLDVTRRVLGVGR